VARRPHIPIWYFVEVVRAAAIKGGW